MVVYVGYYGLGSVFWWTYTVEWGGQVIQPLPRYYGLLLVGYPSQCSWLFWFGWLMYCLLMPELLSPLFGYTLQLLNLSLCLYLFCNDVPQCFVEFFLVYGKLDVCAAGCVVGSSVALFAGVQPWLIAPGSASQVFPGTMMMPYLAETQMMFYILIVLTVLHYEFKTLNMFSFLIGWRFIDWHYGCPLKPRQLMCIVQFQLVNAGIYASCQITYFWHQWPVAFCKAIMLQIFYHLTCIPSTYGFVTSYLPLYLYHMDSIMYFLPLPRIICPKTWYCMMMRQSILHPSVFTGIIDCSGERMHKAILPYDSKACSQYAFGLRLNLVFRIEWFTGTIF